MAGHAAANPVLGGTETEGSLGLAGSQFGPRLSESTCLMGIRQRVREQDTQPLPLTSESNGRPHLYTYVHM